MIDYRMQSMRQLPKTKPNECGRLLSKKSIYLLIPQRIMRKGTDKMIGPEIANSGPEFSNFKASAEELVHRANSAHLFSSEIFPRFCYSFRRRKLIEADKEAN